jgi:hypothetical protein
MLNMLLQVDSTNTPNFFSWANNWYSPIVILALLTLLFSLVRYIILRSQTKPRFNDAWLNESSKSTLSFVIANNRPYSITLLKLYYRKFYLRFFPSRKYKFVNGWDYPINQDDPLFKKTVIVKEQSFIIPLANGELTSNKKYKIYAKTSGGFCKATVRPIVHSLIQDLEKKLKSKK